MLFEQAVSQTAAVSRPWTARAALFSGLLAEVLPILPCQQSVQEENRASTKHPLTEVGKLRCF